MSTIVAHRIEEPRSEHERELYRMLAEMRQRHELEMKPIIDALVQIECCKPPARYVYLLDPEG